MCPIGRLDADSEGLLLLSDEAAWNEHLLPPRHAHEREYWVPVEKTVAGGNQAGWRKVGRVAPRAPS